MTLIKDVRGEDCPEVRVLFYGLLKKRSSRADFFPLGDTILSH